MKEGISVVIPSYMEAENLNFILPNLIKTLKELNVSYQIVVVDSIIELDNTRTVCKNFGIDCIKRENGDYYGDAVRTGIKYAEFDIIVVMDADGSHDPKYIKDLFEKYRSGVECGIVIASRYVKFAQSDHSFCLATMSFIVNVVFRCLFHIEAKDISISYRMYDAAKLKSLSLACMNFDILEEILIVFSMKYPNSKIIEIPSHFKNRNSGRSKRKLVAFIISYMKTIFRLYIKKGV
ncbi:MAG: glycosyltransferase [Endomicrobium sp.]|jgi:dolichol-phosphate mannosyltransferase|nr:glycosyltransferase [Endomicrobium sp.]